MGQKFDKAKASASPLVDITFLLWRSLWPVSVLAVVVVVLVAVVAAVVMSSLAGLGPASDECCAVTRSSVTRPAPA